MDLSSIGLYIMCLNHAWMNDGLPQEWSKIRTIFGPVRGNERAYKWHQIEQEFVKQWSLVEPCFPVAEDGRRRNPRQEVERNKAVKAYEAKVKAANSRWKRNASADADADASAMHAHMHMQSYTEQNSKEHRFSSSESISTDHVFLSGDDRAREQPPPSPNGNAPQNYPLTARAIRESYPATDARFLTELVRTAAAAAADIPQPSALEFSDKLLADAVRRCRNDSPTQRSVRLFLTTVPRCISSWIEYGQEQPPPKLNKTDRMLEEIVAEEQAKRLAKEEKTKLAKGATR
jgi:hypothetical protein